MISFSLKAFCRQVGIPGISVLDPLVSLLSDLEYESSGQSDRQHKMDNAYFDRMGALEWPL